MTNAKASSKNPGGRPKTGNTTTTTHVSMSAETAKRLKQLAFQNGMTYSAMMVAAAKQFYQI